MCTLRGLNRAPITRLFIENIGDFSVVFGVVEDRIASCCAHGPLNDVYNWHHDFYTSGFSFVEGGRTTHDDFECC